MSDLESCLADMGCILEEIPALPQYVDKSTEDDLEGFLPEDPLSVDTGEEQVLALLKAFPESSKEVVRELVSESTVDFVRLLIDGPRGRGRVLAGLCLKQGSATSNDLRSAGYLSATRVASDLQEIGIPIWSEMVDKVATYRLHPRAFRGALERRRPLSVEDRRRVIVEGGHKCAFCGSNDTLQADHRIPFEIAQNTEHTRIGLAAFQPLCTSCNTGKQSSGCGKCSLRSESDAIDRCRTCYYAYPEDYTHVAGRLERRVYLVVLGDAVERLLKFEADAKNRGLTTQEAILERL